MNIQETVLKVIQTTKPNIKSINLHSTLSDDLGLTQLDILNICHKLDSIYNINLATYKFISVADIVNTINKNNYKNMIDSNIFKVIKEVLITNDFYSTKDTISPNSRLIEDFGMDSFDCVEFIVDIERRFGISIPDDDAGNISTLLDVYTCVQKELLKKQEMKKVITKKVTETKKSFVQNLFTKTK